MYIVLLSGGSGKRLWPLSNDLCSKQYIKLMNPDEAEHSASTEKCSMLQRVFGQLKAASLSENTIVCASDSQVELIESQLDGQAEVAVEPMRRNTFPAVMLSCAYLLSNKGAKPDDVVAFLPVDPYTTVEFFNKIKSLGEYIEKQDSVIGLLGGVPTYPSTKYGYIVPEKNGSEPFAVKGFREKPDEATAQELVDMGALWNCGVFCFKLNMAAQWLDKYGVTTNYDEMVADYEKLPKQSFDYEVLEHWKNIVAVQYDGIWKDLGTWNTLTEAMDSHNVGEALFNETCRNVHVVNELNLPVLCMGLKDIVVSASPDGILVSDKEQSSYIKPFVNTLDHRVMFAEKSWGSFRVLDVEKESLTIKVTLNPGHKMNYHSHTNRDEVWTVVSGTGYTIIDGQKQIVRPGDVLRMPAGCKHTIVADTELQVIEVQMGKDISVHDKEKFELAL